MVKISKWDKFRINRTLIVDGFIRARKAKLHAEVMIGLMVKSFILTKMG